MSRKPNFDRPHVFILGAGASKAAFPNGDRNGKSIPLMNELVDVVGLGDLLDERGIPREDDFERTYSKLAIDETLSGTCRELEAKIVD